MKEQKRDKFWLFLSIAQIVLGIWLIIDKWYFFGVVLIILAILSYSKNYLGIIKFSIMDFIKKYKKKPFFIFST